MILVIIGSCRNGDKSDAACVQTRGGLPNRFHLHTVAMFSASVGSIMNVGLNSNEGTDWRFVRLVQSLDDKIEGIWLGKTGTTTIR